MILTINQLKYHNIKDFILNKRIQQIDDVKQFNLLFDDPEYSYLRGLIHVNLTENNAIFFTDIEYNENKTYVLHDLVDVIYHIPYRNIAILNLKALLEKTRDIKYRFSNIYYDTNLISKIGILFKSNSISFLYKLHKYKFINILTTSKNLSVDNFKTNLADTVSDLFSSIEIYRDDKLENLINDKYYSVFNNDHALNLSHNNIKALQYINNEILQNPQKYTSKLTEFRELCIRYLQNASTLFSNSESRSYSASKHTATEIIKNHKLFKIFLIKDDNKYYRSQYSLVFQFCNIKISIIDEYYHNEMTDHFIIAYLMYTNEYENVAIYLKNKLFQSM